MRQLFAAAVCLLLAEGLAVGALIHGGICLVGAHQNAVQGAVILSTAVMHALVNCAFDALIGMTIHDPFLLLLVSSLVWLGIMNLYPVSFESVCFFRKDMVIYEWKY